ncbi:MAG: hypothetical protein M3362_01140 [Acidobacteriota bacterium]|nr:hypothetical protein [Acidobacteriota bacterium]
MPRILQPLKPKQHPVTPLPKFTTELPFFYLTKRKDLLSQPIDFRGTDPQDKPVRWRVTPNPTIGAPGIEAHEVWVRLIKPALDAERERMLGKLPSLIPLGSIRECLRTLGRAIGGWESRRLLKSIRQIGSAWCEADFWMPTAERDEEGRALYRHIKGEFSRISIYSIGSKHLTDEELEEGNFSFDFDLEDTVYLLLHPHEVEMQKHQGQRPIDNEYLFSVNPAARRWYELLAPKIFGVVENRKSHQEGFCEIRYSWYVERHHTLKRHAERYRVVEQMNDLIEDHKALGYVERVEYRAIKEPGQEVDYIIRYYPGEGARTSINRIRSRHPRKKRAAQHDLPSSNGSQPSLPLHPAETVAGVEPEDKLLIAKLTNKPPEGFGISEAKAQELVESRREAVEAQIAAYPYRDLGKTKKNAAGWLIAAIEKNYALPVAYLEEREKEQQAIKKKAAKAAAENCALCDSGGWRRVKTPKYPDGAMKKCTHDQVIESKYLDA